MFCGLIGVELMSRLASPLVEGEPQAVSNLTLGRAILSVCSALLWAAASANPACSQGKLDLAYTLSFAGISFGDITISGEIGASGYTMSGEGRLLSFGPTSSSGKSHSEVRGSVSDSRLTPTRFSSKSNFEKDPMEVTVTYEDGNVKEVSGLNLGRSRVQLSDPDEEAVLDPLTALLVPAGLSNEACQRTVRIFDGYQRFDVVLAFKRRSSIKAKEGYAGPAVVCSARYRPVAGQRGSATVPKFLVDLLVDGEIDITLAPVSGMRVLALFELSAVSMLAARANRFKAVAR
jgi:Protein of unknown function (DUF3108)